MSTTEDIDNFVGGLKVAELREELKKMNLPYHGNKAALGQRLREAMERKREEGEEEEEEAETTVEAAAEEEEEEEEPTPQAEESEEASAPADTNGDHGETSTAEGVASGGDGEQTASNEKENGDEGEEAGSPEAEEEQPLQAEEDAAESMATEPAELEVKLEAGDTGGCALIGILAR